MKKLNLKNILIRDWHMAIICTVAEISAADNT